MKKLIYLLILLAIACSFGCKKRFVDGPLISFRSVKQRIHGTWKVDKFYINGADSTDEFNAKVGCEIEFTGNIYNGEDNFWCFFFKNCNNGKTLNGFWYFFQGDKSELALTPLRDTTFLTVPGPFSGNDDSENWIILRLTNQELNAKIFATPWWGVPTSTEYVLYLKKQ